jgi:hypothetical protein
MADSSRYTIDIAAEMTGTETLGELDALADKLDVGGKKSDAFQQAVKRLSADLDAAKAASAAATAALAAGNDKYRELEGAATRAAKAVEKAAINQPVLAANAVRASDALEAYRATLAKIGADSVTEDEANRLKMLELSAARAASAVARAAAKQSGIAAEYTAADAALKAYSADLGVLEKASAGATAKQAALGKQLANINKLGGHADARVAALNQKYEKLGQAVQFLPGPLGRVAGSFIQAQRAGFGLLNTLGATRSALLLTGIGAVAAAGAFAALAYSVLKRIPGADDQIEQLGKNVKALFKGLNFEPLQAALGVIVGMFSKANPLAEVFRIVGTAAFNTFSELVLAAAYAVEAFALDVSIAAVKAYLFFRKYGDEIESVLLGVGIALVAFGIYWAVTNAAVIVGLAAQAVAWAATGAAAAAAWLVAAAPAILVIAAIAAVGYAIGQLIFHWDEVVAGIKLIWADLTAWLGAQVASFTQIGSDLMLGLVAGITGAVGAVITAVSDAVGSAVTAAKSVLGIASPSKVFAEIGGYTAEGFSAGVDAGAGEAQGSMAALVAPTPAVMSAAAPAPAAEGGGGARGGKSIDLSGAVINFNGVKDAETHGKAMLTEFFTQLLEGDADSMAGAAA